VQVTRVSSSSGKVTEASNYFTEGAAQGQGQVLFVPILKSRAKREEEPALPPSATAVTSGTFGLSNPLVALGQGKDKDRDRDKEQARTASTVTGARNIALHDNRRLITFDSTDPEFDEDSDPDADLDL
jgi:hypothetical protein